MATTPAKPNFAFGTWLRGVRLEHNEPIRAVAASAQMDQALLSKIELGQRWPTDEQVTAFARFFKIDAAEIKRRLVSARFWADYGVDDPDLASAIGAQVQEDAAAYRVNNPVNKPVNRRRVKK